MNIKTMYGNELYEAIYSETGNTKKTSSMYNTLQRAGLKTMKDISDYLADGKDIMKQRGIGNDFASIIMKIIVEYNSATTRNKARG